jgi:hypothetical protein
MLLCRISPLSRMKPAALGLAIANFCNSCWACGSVASELRTSWIHASCTEDTTYIANKWATLDRAFAAIVSLPILYTIPNYNPMSRVIAFLCMSECKFCSLRYAKDLWLVRTMNSSLADNVSIFPLSLWELKNLFHKWIGVSISLLEPC